MATTTIICPQCGLTAEKATGGVNRSRAAGSPVYCSRSCAGVARRSNKTAEQKKREKAQYDAEYRVKNADKLKSKKAAYFKATYDPKAARNYRKSRAHIHAEYCRSPEYREWKRNYDRQYRAKKDYGEFAEAFLAMQDLRNACLERATDYEIRQAAGTTGKAQKRKRHYDRTFSTKSQRGTLGNPSGSEAAGNYTG